MHPCKGDPGLSALFLQPLAWGRLKNCLNRTVVASSLLCNMKGAEIALKKGYLFSDETILLLSERDVTEQCRRGTWVLLPWLTLFESDKLAEEETKVQLTPSPHLQPLKNTPKHPYPLHSCCQTCDQSPVSQFFQKGLKHNFTFELRENIILKRDWVIFSPNTQNY